MFLADRAHLLFHLKAMVCRPPGFVVVDGFQKWFSAGRPLDLGLIGANWVVGCLFLCDGVEGF